MITKLIENRYFKLTILLLIIISICDLIIMTLPGMEPDALAMIWGMEHLIIGLFCVELMLRLGAALESHRYRGYGTALAHFFSSWLNWVDIFVVVSFFLDTHLGERFAVLRIFRLVRILSLIFKTSRFSKSLQTLGHVIRIKGADLVTTLLLVLILLLISATLMYYVESSVQPESFASIPDTMWWAVATLTTVGYGDVYPVTALGKLIAAFIAILGIGLFALPAGILGSGYLEVRTYAGNTLQRCPHCNRQFDQES